MNGIRINVDKVQKTMIHPLPGFGGQSPGGSTLGVSSKYFIKNGKPWYPVMGEFHFSRYPHTFWEESILKMKAGGIQVIATYIFWIHHEEIEGEFLWTENYNLRQFIHLCGKHQMQVLPRIGPWAHGECRNGGFPDWLLKKDMEIRTNDPRYLSQVRILYSQIFEQARGMLFKEGGPVIGVQIENEYGHCGGLQGEAGKAHIAALKKIAIECGFDVPFYTTTGWGGGIVVDGETLPVLGAYADAPWAQHIRELPASKEFVFSGVKLETDIGTDLKRKEVEEFTYDVNRYPYATAELGGGLQVTQHRRPIVMPQDVEAMALVKMGSGANLLGYYMYHGGTNPMGKLSTLQESRETGYANDLPVLSYDFQAPIREYGQISDTFKYLKILHLFLEDFGDRLADTSCIIPEDSAKDPEDRDTLRYAIRAGSEGGFVFLNNYQRHRKLEDKKDIHIAVSNVDREFLFEPLDLPNGRSAILPYNMDLEGARLLTSTAQPLCKLRHGETTTFVFFGYEDTRVTYLIDAKDSVDIKVAGENCIKGDGMYSCIVEKPGSRQGIEILLACGKKVNILTLDRKDAENAWKYSVNGIERLFITEGTILPREGNITLTTRKCCTALSVYPDFEGSLQVAGAEMKKIRREWDFGEYEISFVPAVVQAAFEEEAPKEDGTRVYQMHVDTDFREGIGDNFLTLAFEGDQAKMYINDEFCADWFYTGQDWDMGLKRFRKALPHAEVRIEITPLAQDAYVYLEKKPKYEQGVACRMLSATMEAEYGCSFSQL